MKILYCHPYAINTPHFETDLEIIQRHLDKGDEITMLGCNANLLACDVNLYHDFKFCLKCIGRRSQGLKMLSDKIAVKPIFFLKQRDREELKRLRTNFGKMEDLKVFEIENFDIGYGVLSSMISLTRKTEIDIISNINIIESWMVSAIAVYRSIQNYLSEGNFDRVYAYNGRYAIMRAVLRACQSKKVECLMHERGSRITRYDLLENTMPHDIDYIRKRIKEMWTAGNNKLEKEKIGSQFYIDIFNSISHMWIPYTKDQQQNLLPDGWDDTKNNIAIFCSSEDEFVAVGEKWKNPLYNSQNEGIIRIFEGTKGHDSIHFYLRIHPNLKNVKNKQTDLLNSLNYTHLTIIPAESPVSSYTLLLNASKIVTFGSRVGIEAVFWGKPSISVGQCFYRDLGSTYNPETHDALIDLLYKDLPSKNKEGALMYGYFFNTFGIEFKYYEAKGIYEGLFKGKPVTPGRLYRRLEAMLDFDDLNRKAGKLSMYYNRHVTGRTKWTSQR